MPRHYDPNQPRVRPAIRRRSMDRRRLREDAKVWPSVGPALPFAAPVIAGAGRFATQKAIEAALLMFAWLSARNSRDKQTVIAFKANEYPVEGKVLNVEGVRRLDRDETNDICKKLEKVQELTDKAALEVRKRPTYRTAAEYGTAVHSELKEQIEKLGNPDFRAEKSYLKTKEEVSDQKEGERYGLKNSIRVDVFENTKKGTVCVYDIKTGRRGLSIPRMLEIAGTVFKYFKDTQRIIVTEVRPTR